MGIWGRQYNIAAHLLHEDLHDGKEDFVPGYNHSRGEANEGEALTENARRKENSKRMERSVLSTVLGLTAIYLVCWTPIYVLQKLDTDCNSFKFSIWKFLLLSLHALLDPLCYSLRTAKFRRALLKIWSELFNHNNGGTFGR